ncbi:uncharacterized protein LOC132716529 [Ruditapes philippinarum]|uniref:uncharacterized protein LOC132716529 n=1 Tax=Ruditapes philippinarum TaxID=129788 RepID=UPI00295C13ED|nr:uncharacterized protein LOC132716529 [Ruditapes philippinarum]
MENNTIKYKSFAAVTQDVCQTLANYYYSKTKLHDFNKGDKNNMKDLFSQCVFCCNKFSGGNHKVRIIPKPALNKNIKRLLTRHEKESSTLGKFQTKLVNDYIHSKNTLTVTCNVCKKTSKVPGLSRAEKQKFDLLQNKKLNLQEELEDIKVPSKKEKKKEKKKLQRKRKADGLTEEDITAGLKIPRSTGLAADQDVTEDRLNPRLPESFEDDDHLTKPSTPSNEIEKLCRTETVKEKNRSHKTMSEDVLQSNTRSYSQIQNKQTNKQTSAKTGIASIPKTLPSVQKRQKKKQRSKKMSQHLSNILKKEQEKKTEGTLADFLSSV